MTCPVRCPWSYAGMNEAYVRYHDQEWGVPVHDERTQFEFLLLEGAQAGLSWATILKKRQGYREAFADFDPAAVARFGPAEVERLMGFPGIVRNRLKIESAIINAQKTLAVQDEFGGLDAFLWSFVDGNPIINHWQDMAEVPAHSAASDRLSQELRRRGFKFVGSTIIYAHMQATGMVNDHLITCFRHAECQNPKVIRSV
ncbi:DNA-3-methyladenine glycosylase I [Methylotetracoccus oryzae]|uniref:DNA-3-methyladenine glycosylase I n=1 Tax=Methylotetracoccus oryzae TaxID=1919059 RepID=UPI001911E856|nr:DNA-3-methyladenine glycosylase I [Methylotetracoccus oryzae]